MILHGKQKLRDFCDKYADARSPLSSWETEVEDAQWRTPQDIKNKYPKASIVDGKNIVFDICGNKYRLWVLVAYKMGIVTIIDVGTHTKYNKWKIK